MIDVVLAAASIAVLVGLLYVYGTNFRTLRAPLSLGLLIFAAMFLVGNLAAIFFYVSWNESLSGTRFAADVAMPIVILNTVQLAGFIALFFVSWR